MKVRRVLVFPAGTEIGLEVVRSLHLCKEVAVFGAGVPEANHGMFVVNDYRSIPMVGSPGWMQALEHTCRELAIDYVIPAHDDVVVALADCAGTLPARLIGSPPETCRILRSKSATYAALAGAIRVPQVFPPDAVGDFPVLVKPDRGEGSRDVRVARNWSELSDALQRTQDPIICEYLPGEEFTVDCFSDRERGVLFAGARARRRTRNGIAVNTVTTDLPEAIGLASRIASRLSLRGAWFFQLKRAADQGLCLLEVGPRIAGSMSAHRVLGVNFPLLSIFEEERLPISIMTNAGPVEVDRALGNRYRQPIAFSTMYVDLDDTLVCGGLVNLELVKLIFASINRGCKIVLLTRHREDLRQTLARHRLSGLFDEIHHLRCGERKSDSIVGNDSIFVDDSFAERLDVAQRHGIPTFDSSMIEVLTEQATWSRTNA